MTANLRGHMEPSNRILTIFVIALLTLLGAAVSSPVLANPITLSCTAPTHNTDGTVMVDFAGIRFYESLTTGGPYTVLGSSPSCSWQTQPRAPGIYFFATTAYNTSGVESVFSNEAVKTITEPGPPTDLVVLAGNLTAYAVSQTEDVIVEYPVGTVPEGTACDATMRFNDKYVVPRAMITWAGTARPLVVFASCGSG